MAQAVKDLLRLDKQVFVVAEIGKAFIQTEEAQTVTQYIINAKRLIEAAKAAGADAVKFQTHNVEDEQLNVPITAPHFSGVDRYAWVKRNTEAAPLEFWQEIKRFADGLGILFFTTPMSRGAAQNLALLDLPLWKVASSDILDFVLLDYLAQTGKPIILSVGMSTPEEIDMALDFLRQRTQNIILLYCVSKYPCPKNELYLETIPFLRDRYGLPVGFSDHSLEIESAAAAVSQGAVLVEKHFSLRRDFWGSDHKVSLLPEEFKLMAAAIRGAKKIDPAPYGRGVKVLDEEEGVFRPVFRKSLMAGQDIPAGTVIKKEMIYAMRPQVASAGLPSEAYAQVIGKKALKPFKKYQPITIESIA